MTEKQFCPRGRDARDAAALVRNRFVRGGRDRRDVAAVVRNSLRSDRFATRLRWTRLMSTRLIWIQPIRTEYQLYNIVPVVSIPYRLRSNDFSVFRGRVGPKIIPT